MRPNKETRKIWAEKTFELTNIATGALLFGQFLSDKPVNASLAFAGICFFSWIRFESCHYAKELIMYSYYE